MSDRSDVERYLSALFAGASQGSFIELRWRTAAGMDRTFFDAANRDAVAAAVSRLSGSTDVYVGVLPRRRRGGGRADLVDAGAVLWADCDSASAVAALDEFTPQPSILIASGSADHRHGYWLLPHPVSLVEIEGANRQLARALGADTACAEPARILRPAPSWNHKTGPRSRVELLRCDASARPLIEEIVGARFDGPSALPRRAPRENTHDDPLLRVPPWLYVEALTGMPVPGHRKVPCPFHTDRTPSLHVYDEPERGWYCFGCRRGGSVYDLGSAIFGLATRGSDFRLLQQRLDAELSPLIDLTLGS